MADVPLLKNENGLVTLGLADKSVDACRIAHQSFLTSHDLKYWKLIVVQIPETSRILIYSGGTGTDEKPDYTLTDAPLLTERIGEILAAHHEQTKRRTLPAGAR